MVDLCLTREELEKALAQLNIAYENGFKHSLAVVRLTEIGKTVSDHIATYDSLILKAHPTSPNKDWTCHHPEWYVLKNGKCVDKE